MENHITGSIFQKFGKVENEYTGKVSNGNIIESYFVNSKISCVQKCLAKDYCEHVNYRYIQEPVAKMDLSGQSNNCELIYSTKNVDFVNLERKHNWKLLSLKKVCIICCLLSE